MRLQLPQFSATYCESFTACGEIEGADDELKAWLTKDDSPKFIRYRAKGTMGVIRFFSGGNRGSHIHFDVSLPSWFDGDMPDSTHKRSDIDKTVSRANGMQLDVGIIAYMRVPKATISSPIVSLLDPKEIPFDDESNIATLKFTGLEIEQTGQAFDKLVLHDDENNYFIRFSFEQEATLNENYLPNMLNRIDAAFTSMFDVEPVR